MWWVAALLGKFQNEVQGSEMFMTAKRSINTGLVASAVVSSYGVSGAYFYGAGASVQIFVFAVSAMELKRRAPGCHTFLEIARIRYGSYGHCIQIVYSTMYQIINCVNILVGGSAVFTALTGMNTIAAIWTIPIGVVTYTLSGGIKATILVDYSHTIIIYALVLTGLFVVYATSDALGSPDTVYQLLREAAQQSPVEGNASGEYLTMSSRDGILLGVVFWCAVFGTTVDVQLYQKAITASPRATLPGYLIGGLAWFTIPFCLATTFGLAARALENSPSFPTYPRQMTALEVSHGLPLPYAAQALMGKGGAGFILLMTFMACTSGFSADIVAVASVFVYDVYGTYINRQATGGRLLKWSIFAVIAWTVCMAVIATGISRTTIGVNYLVTCMGVFTCSFVFPMYSTILWRKQNKAAILFAAPLGSLTAIACWLSAAYRFEGAVTVATTSAILPLVVGNSVSLISGGLYSVLITLIFGPDNFDWNRFKTELKAIDDSDIKGLSAEQLAEQLATEQLSTEDEKALRRGKKIGITMAVTLCAIFVILIPLPMYGTRYVFSKPFYRFWVVVTFVLAWAATLVILIMPIWQGRHTLRLFTLYVQGKAVKSKRVENSAELLHGPKTLAND
ncbi:MAG: hypothetical protein Q9227_005945 [Pyrenula ochraceoflavens]